MARNYCICLSLPAGTRFSTNLTTSPRVRRSSRRSPISDFVLLTCRTLASSFSLKTETRDAPLQRDQFETLYRRIEDAPDGFDLDRLPPDADPYPTVWSVHPRFEVDEDAGIITQSAVATATQVMGVEQEPTDDERTEPDGLDVYSDALLLIDALERHDVTTLRTGDRRVGESLNPGFGCPARC